MRRNGESHMFLFKIENKKFLVVFQVFTAFTKIKLEVIIQSISIEVEFLK